MFDRPAPIQQMPDDAELVFQGQIFDVYQWQQQMFDGSYATFEKLKRGDSVAVIPVQSDGKILLARQEQPGKLPYISALGGQVDPGEDIQKAVQRELLEETGLTAKNWQAWYAEQPASKVDWAIFYFIAKDLTVVAEQSLDSGEKIEVLALDFDEFLDVATSPGFVEVSISRKAFQAKLDPSVYQELKQLFQP